ncbi:pectate lyase [Ceratobasidium sp. AG-Ba]|nr:pectate lyase [Ceratobasidium sp. AG-Ba]
MKFLSAISVLAIFAQITVGAPTIERRAAVSDEANIGYAAQGSSALADDAAKIVVVSGTISGNTVVKVGSNKSVVGKSGASLVGVGLRVNKKSNVIIRNLKISKVLASAGDAIGIQESSRVWVDHVDLSSDQTHDKDFYDGLLDVTHGSTFVSVTNSILHDHWKASLVGHSDNNGSEDKAITVTYALNKWVNLNSRMPSFRFGTGHLFNNYFLNSGDGINTRLGAQLLVENNVWESVKKALYSTDGGFAVARGNEFGGGSSAAPAGTFKEAPYSYALLDASAVKSAVSTAGATLSF